MAATIYVEIIAMKTLVFFLMTFPTLLNAQSVNMSMFIAAPSYTLLKSSSSEVPTGSTDGALGTGAGFSFDYLLPPVLSVGISIDYFFSRGLIYSNCNCVQLMDRVVSLRNTMSSHNLDIPFYFTFRLNKSQQQFFYLKTGIGISALLSSHRVVEREVVSFSKAPTIRTEISRGHFYLSNVENRRFGNFYMFSVGQAFKIKGMSFYSELLLRQDLNSWVYQKDESSNSGNSIHFRKQAFVLKFGRIF